jgi:hypothetical protein
MVRKKLLHVGEIAACLRGGLDSVRDHKIIPQKLKRAEARAKRIHRDELADENWKELDAHLKSKIRLKRREPPCL